jgi:hypothetical protein
MTDPLLPEFDVDSRLGPHASKNIGRMYLRFGMGPANKMCVRCRHFHRYSMGSTWFKCALSGPTSSNATDWRARWRACGAFDEAEP